jgi:alginate O-acetyltransferase complex protein AlgJ
VSLPRPVLLASALVVLVALAVPSASTARVDQPSTTFTGADGLYYSYAPGVVAGQQDYLFLGNDFDFACGIGPAMRHSLAAYAKLARIIRRSGRRVVFTVAPDKTAALSAVRPSQPPHGVCDQEGLAAQDQLLEHFGDPDFLPLLAPLRRSPHQVYWRTDQHWTTVGGSVFARALATHLTPRLGQQQRYTYGTETRLGILNLALGVDAPETLETAAPAGRVKVRTAKGAADWGGYPEFTFEHAWDSAPANRTWPGRTLLLGDSFMWYALENLRPVFRHGHFVWIDHTGTDVPQAIKSSDTVVIELLQLFLPTSSILTPAFRRTVARELGR